jgi:hypothetical protein
VRLCILYDALWLLFGSYVISYLYHDTCLVQLQSTMDTSCTMSYFSWLRSAMNCDLDACIQACIKLPVLWWDNPLSCILLSYWVSWTVYKLSPYINICRYVCANFSCKVFQNELIFFLLASRFFEYLWGKPACLILFIFGSLVSGNSHGLLLGEAATQVLQWELELMILQVVSLLLNYCYARLSCYQTCITWCIYLRPFANVLISCIWCIWQEPSLSCSLAEDLQDVKLEDTGSPF